jgi:hypothetical protein
VKPQGLGEAQSGIVVMQAGRLSCASHPSHNQTQNATNDLQIILEELRTEESST